MNIKRCMMFSITAAALCLSSATQVGASITVAGNNPTPTLIGSLDSGMTYEIAAMGIVNLSGRRDETFTADGIPTSTNIFGIFFPNGVDHDPTGSSSFPGTGGYGQGGAGMLLGALLGTFTATPTGPADFFTLGLSDTITATSNENLYAVVNDTNYGDNRGQYSVTSSTVSGAPEPSSWALMIMGVGVAGMALRRQGRKASAMVCATA